MTRELALPGGLGGGVNVCSYIYVEARVLAERQSPETRCCATMCVMRHPGQWRTFEGLRASADGVRHLW
jgi:hypothetical protein